MKMTSKISFFLVFSFFLLFFPQPALATEYSKAVVFIQGGGTSLDSMGNENTFNAIKTQLLFQGFTKDKFLEFSYNGGKVNNLAQWHAYPYSCGATGKGLTTSVNILIDMISQYSAKNPGTKMVLLGHSLGGVLGVNSLQGVIDGRIGQGLVDSVITLDSPLRGVPLQNMNLYEKFLGCLPLIGSPISIDMVNMYSNLPATDVFNAAMVSQSNVAVHTLGNNQDCVYDTAQCRFPGIDWTSTQTIQTADTRLYDLGNNLRLGDAGHKRILSDPQTVSDIVALIVGN